MTYRSLAALLTLLATGLRAGDLPAFPAPTPVHENTVEAVFKMPEYTDRLIEDIRVARKTVYLDKYFLGGSYGRRVALALHERLNAGVDVRVVIDKHLGTIGKLRKQVKAVYRLMKRRGIPVRMAQVRGGKGMHRRVSDHNKLAVLDGKVAYVGGTNISDIWLRYQDLMVRAEGPIARHLEQQFLHDWALAVEPSLGESLPDLSFQSQALLVNRSSPGKSSIRLLGTGPGRRTFEGGLLSCIRNARSSIEVQVHQLNHEVAIDELIRAHERGVAVRVFLDPTNFDNLVPLIKKGPRYVFNAYAATRLKEAGVPVRFIKVDETTEAYHMKLAVFDAEILLVGTANWDHRATDLLTETVLEIAGGPVVGEIRTWFDGNWENLSEEPEVGYIVRLANYLMRKFL